MNGSVENGTGKGAPAPVEHLIKKQGFNYLPLLTGICTTFGASVPVGYNIGVVNAPGDFIREWTNATLIQQYDIHLSLSQLKFLFASIVSIFLIGGAIGSLCGAYVADKVGRKGSFLLCAVLFLVGGICFHFCRAFDSVGLIILGRFIVGLASGLTTCTVPIYLTEIAPLKLRGTLGVLCSMGVTGGVVVGQVVSLNQLFGSENMWHCALSSYTILVVIFLTPYHFLPESPKYLYMIANHRDAARNELARLLQNNSERIDAEIHNMMNSSDRQIQKQSICSVVKDRKLRLPLILVAALQGGQQLSGINAVFYYSVSIFISAGFSPNMAKWANLGAGCINLITAFFSPLLMGKVNRRPLILLSCLASGVFLFILVFIVYYIEQVSWFPFACIASIFGYIVAYQVGLGPIPYFIGSELFDVGPRPAAMAIGSVASWSCNFAVGMLFQVFQTMWGAFVFLPFSIVCIFLAILLKFYLPETRDKDVSEVASLVADGFRSRPTSQRDYVFN